MYTTHGHLSLLEGYVIPVQLKTQVDDTMQPMIFVQEVVIDMMFLIKSKQYDIR
jgi:hypothetical protein